MKKQNKGKKGLKIILIVLLCIAVLAAAGYGISRVYIASVTPEEYMITSENYFDYQKNYECSGYASAYVLRSMGEDANGLELYNQFENKDPDGGLMPFFLEKNLDNMGYKCKSHTGTLTDLKYHVSKGTPVIAFVKANTFQPYLHYIAVVGYDDDYIYAADSVEYMVNCRSEKHYNRRIEEEDFIKLWKNDTFLFDNIFLTVEK